MVVQEQDEDKRLITGEVLQGSKSYPKGTTVVFGKYALFQLTLRGEDIYFLNEDDVLAITNYKE